MKINVGVIRREWPNIRCGSCAAALPASVKACTLTPVPGNKSPTTHFYLCDGCRVALKEFLGAGGRVDWIVTPQASEMKIVMNLIRREAPGLVCAACGDGVPDDTGVLTLKLDHDPTEKRLWTEAYFRLCDDCDTQFKTGGSPAFEIDASSAIGFADATFQGEAARAIAESLREQGLQ